jgi:ParB family chromosome partitioning protein
MNDVDALFLALKTNLIREGMSEREQGKVLHQITQEYNISQNELSKRIGKTRQWVDRRIKLALDLADAVVDALEKDIISMSVAEVISSLARSEQPKFLKYLIDTNLTKNEKEVRNVKKRFLNNTIYTIGYEARDLPTFIQTLKDNFLHF